MGKRAASLAVRQVEPHKIDLDKCPASVAINKFQLPQWERYICWLCTILSMLHLNYRFYIISQEHYDTLKGDSFTEGWSFLHRKKHVSNFDWKVWNIWIPFMIPCFIVHAVIGQALRWHCNTFKYRSYIMMVVDIALTIHLIGVQPVIMLSSHCVLVYITALMICHPGVVWMVSLGLLLSLNTDYVLSIVIQMLGDDPFHSKYFLVIKLSTWGFMRYTSFTLEMCNKSKDDVNGYSFVDLLAYVFYFPQYINGPHQNYDMYKKQMSGPLIPWTRSRILAWSFGLARAVFWWCFMEVSLHYIYLHAIILSPPILVQLSSWTLSGAVAFESFFFGVMYQTIYGLSEKLAELDQLVPPLPPGCAWRMYSYSTLWKRFDRGLHHFIKRYIYIPLGGSRHGIARRLLAYCLAFIFLFNWHGRSSTIFIWTSVHWFGMTAEYFVCHLEKYPRVAAFHCVYPQTFMRVALVLQAVMYMSILTSMIFYFADTNSGFVCSQAYLYGFPILVPMYYAWQVALRDVEAWLEKRQHRSLKDY